jgi:hypothetical protein
MPGDRRLERAQRTSTGAPISGLLRVARGSAVGATAMGLAVGGHVAGGGQLPAPTNAVALLCLSVAGCVALSGRRWTVAALVTVLLSVQVAFHVALADHASTATAAYYDHSAHSLGVTMVIAHVLAAGVTALLLTRGESWCWRLVTLLGRPVLVARWMDRRVGPIARPALLPLGHPRLLLLRSLLLADSQPRRGPPALLAR